MLNDTGRSFCVVRVIERYLQLRAQHGPTSRCSLSPAVLSTPGELSADASKIHSGTILKPADIRRIVFVLEQLQLQQQTIRPSVKYNMLDVGPLKHPAAVSAHPFALTQSACILTHHNYHTLAPFLGASANQ